MLPAPVPKGATWPELQEPRCPPGDRCKITRQTHALTDTLSVLKVIAATHVSFFESFGWFLLAKDLGGGLCVQANWREVQYCHYQDCSDSKLDTDKLPVEYSFFISGPYSFLAGERSGWFPDGCGEAHPGGFTLEGWTTGGPEPTTSECNLFAPHNI